MQITVIATISAAGQALPPHMIAKGKTVKSLASFQPETAPIGTTWSVSDSGWTKQGIASLWFVQNFLKYIGPERPQMLILDGHDFHNFVKLIELAIRNNISLVELPAHTSHWLQPCDRTVFGPLKRYYNEECQQMMNMYPGIVVSRHNFCNLMKSAWEKALTSENIQAGFKACGIFPLMASEIPSDAYLPNSTYSVGFLLANRDMLEAVSEEQLPAVAQEVVTETQPSVIIESGS